MENLTHTLLGAALSKAGLDRTTILATPALLVAVNLPDIDIFGSLIGEKSLDFHRGITHSLVGVTILSLLLAGAFWARGNYRARDPGRRVHFLPMLGVCFIGALSNPVLDCLNDYGMRPWLPFSSQKYYGDLISIADPWLWILLEVPVYGLIRSNPRKFLWMAIGLLPFIAVSLVGGILLGLVWLLALVACVWLWEALATRGFNPARVTLLMCLAYLGVTWLAREYVVRTASQAAPAMIAEAIERIDVLPGRPGSWLRWTVIVQNSSRYWIADIGLHNWQRQPPRFEIYEKNLDHPAYRQSLSQEQMAVMARFARFPSVTVEDSKASRVVYLVDLRYARRNREGFGTARAVVPWPAHP